MSAESIYNYVDTYQKSINPNDLVHQPLSYPNLITDPLYEPVSLVPCAHKIQKTVAEYFFGKTVDGWMVSPSDKPCPFPLCKAKVKGYIVDHTYQNTINNFYTFTEDLKTQLSELKRNNKIHYPGIKGEFVFREGNLEKFDAQITNKFQYMRFINDVKGAFLKSFSITKDENSEIKISFSFNKRNKITAIKYLKKFNLILTEDNPCYYQTKNKNELVTAFDIISKNNEIPEPYLSNIKEIINKVTNSRTYW